MFDIGWDEVLLIGLIALVVIGPKDLPPVLRAVGQWVARARNLAGEFRSHVDEMIRERGVEDMKREFKESMSVPDEMKEFEHQLMTGESPQRPSISAPEPAASPVEITPPTETPAPSPTMSDKAAE